ncbi:aspartate-alanine antiporter [Cereibacter sphaeroides]|uniref:aspartate-alanine antiporter n=1 Tax=Cereibacter sphaeroides TaxID=1063 RepID=UPI001F26E0B8|nr:aspartate-alanine antiporter [Cereibacter sphaeroides]MCE6951463.1 aspartate-alanine antiporter [Cereibacter sphaeroides]MCE6960789.1 aspartate-alanine antiporter [Cereibacter sphaeroides]MCE6969945.1 aspartate-alanine antiporter [Cereibacter sphaeroides]MCE6974333.1 aspartate-alanine antiporter [Cereibacter sphaeroides]
MWDYITETLRANPALAIFFTLAVGYWIGTRKLGSFSLGAVTGTLLAGVIIGQIGIDISAQVKSIFFIMFLFAVGFGVGPQFVRGIATDGAPQALFAVVICALCLLGVYIAAIVSGYGPGLAAGLIAGSQTISASIGLATDAINTSGLTPEEAKAQLDLIPVAYAVTYLFGTIGTGWILAFLGPKLLGTDIAAACARYEREVLGGAKKDSNFTSAWRAREMRAYRIREGGAAVGKKIAAAEAMAKGERIFVERLRRGGELVQTTPDTMLMAGDVVAVAGRREVLVNLLGQGEEVEDRELLDVPVEAVDVLITAKELDGVELGTLATDPMSRGLYLNSIRRGAMSVNIPLLPGTKLNRGDILRVVGAKAQVQRFVERAGFADRPQTITDMVLVGLAILIGGLIGAYVLPIGGVPITLSTSGGALIAGIFVGWLRTVKPWIGNVPQPTLWFMNSVGLNVFIAVVGISSGPTFVAGLQQAGFGIFFWGLFATGMPMILAPLIGKYLFRFDDAINLGCCGGARTSTASVAMVGEVAKSDVPMLGYTVPYAVGNTLLTLWGLVIVLLLV